MVENKIIRSPLTCSVEEAAKILGISRSMAYQLVRSEGFPTVKIGRRLLVSVKGLERWVEAQTGANVGQVIV